MNITVNIPDGYEIDKDKSTPTNIVFKPIPVTPLSIMDKVKTFEDAYRLSKWSDRDIRHFINEYNKYPPHLYAQLKLEIIIEVLNEGWTPDWTDSNEYKYYLLFEMAGSSGFRFDDFVDWNTRSLVSSRLCYRSKKLAKYGATQFIDLYKQAFT